MLARAVRRHLKGDSPDGATSAGIVVRGTPTENARDFFGGNPAPVVLDLDDDLVALQHGAHVHNSFAVDGVPRVTAEGL